MTAKYDPDETARLIAEAREDDARMTPAPWDDIPLIVRIDDDTQPTNSDARGIARTRNNLATLADQFDAAQQRIAELEAEAREPRGCAAHYGSIHGGEAEELRKGIETIIKSFSDCEDQSAMRGNLIRLLDRVDARDSLAHVELRDELERLTAASEHSVDKCEHDALRRETYSYVAALRAIYPVYRAVRKYLALDEPFDAIEAAVTTARAALTPDLVAALRAAGLEES